MGFYIRKSISAGPFRFNLSKSGVGLSVGVRGLRVGTGPRGHYVHAGIGGLYYRSSIGRAGQASRPAADPAHRSVYEAPQPQPQPPGFYHPTVDMVEVESGDVMAMADSRFSDVLADLNGRAAAAKMSQVLGGAGLAVWFVAILVLGFTNALAFLLLAAAFWSAGAYWDSYHRSSVVFYDLEEEAHLAYLKLVDAFETLARCGGKWHVAAGGAVRDLHTWKRSAGASHIVAKSPTELAFALPLELKSNVTPPSMGVGKQILYFLPDVILFRHDGRFGAIGYDRLEIAFANSRFIEDGTVPRDSKVVDWTWRYVNKNGGPDRRFNDNRQIPICLYEQMHLKSASGLNELLEFSKCGVVEPFDAAVRGLARVLGSEAPARAQLPAR